MKYKSVFAVLAFFIISCGQNKQGTQVDQGSQYPVSTFVRHPEWSKNSVIYEVNIRQYSEEGTFNAFAEHLPRLQKLGVDILWLMPVYPIGELNMKAAQTVLVEEIQDPDERKKYLGSPYSIKDFLNVNPDLGSKADLKLLVNKIHELGMHVILDIAVNHTAWDHPWVKAHPDYYTRIDTMNLPWNPEWMQDHPEYFDRIKKLQMTYPIEEGETDWWDAADLNYNNNELRNEMKSIFKYWVSEIGVDGYRCDVAGRVPCDFWNDVRAGLDSIKPVFMLAEDEDSTCLLNKAFDMNYAWKFHHVLNDIAKGDKTVEDLKNYFYEQDTTYDPGIYRMNFITNHDENSWNGSEFERMGDAVEVLALLTFTVPGMPMIYTGQEIGLTKRLKFFESDPITWRESSWENTYQNFIELKRANRVLWNGTAGGEMKILKSNSAGIFSFTRTSEEEELLVITNLSGMPDSTYLPDRYSIRDYTNVFTKEKVNVDGAIVLKPYKYLVLKEQ